MHTKKILTMVQFVIKIQGRLFSKDFLNETFFQMFGENRAKIEAFVVELDRVRIFRAENLKLQIFSSTGRVLNF